jgi:hypothetical protein
MHKALKLCVLPLAVVLELLLLVLVWMLATCMPPTAARLTAWAERTLPGADWYLSHNDTKQTTD